MTFEPYDHFEVVTDGYAGGWIVRRLRDRRLMAHGGCKEMLRWLRTWGPERT